MYLVVRILGHFPHPTVAVLSRVVSGIAFYLSPDVPVEPIHPINPRKIASQYRFVVSALVGIWQIRFREPKVGSDHT